LIARARRADLVDVVWAVEDCVEDEAWWVAEPWPLECR
jgi:hypothetical protein